MLKRAIKFLLILFLGTGSVFGQTKHPKDELPQEKVDFIRTIFYEAVEDEDKNDEMYEYIENALKSHPSNPSFLTAYLGASETLVAKHSYNPYTKWTYLKKGLVKIDDAIRKYKESLELRFLRFSILHYLPSFLGFSKEREEDLITLYRLLLKKDYSEIDFEVQTGIINFLIESERLTSKQIKELEKITIAKK
ncbi:MAG: hypothetical protein RBR95_03250 [Ignavibacteriaceae bacterium]|jgi:hypothetical protein|nr:hypothetical protein [Ignavibacteriaceae bacterium]